MKFAAALVALLAVAVTAMPATDKRWDECNEHSGSSGSDSGSGSGSGNTNVCSSSNQKQVCCNGGLLGCAVSILGHDCSGSSHCCETDSQHGALINLNLLNCVDL